MAATTGVATPITGYRVRGSTGAQLPMRRYAEKALQTFLQGTPVQIDVTGFLIACAAIVNVATAILAGFSQDPASNLTTSGVAQTQTLTQKVPNQPNASLIPLGAPPNDGLCGIQLAIPQTSWQGKLGNSSNAPAAVLAQAMVGSMFGLTKDAGTGFWYVDQFITTTVTGACIEVTGLIDPVGTLNGRIEFIIINAAQQLSA